MKEFSQQLYEFVRNVSYYMVFLTVLMQIMPENQYKPYLRFYMGLLLILMVCMPVFSIFHANNIYESKYKIEEFESFLEETKEVTEYLYEFDSRNTSQRSE